jgi:RNA polymerase sigma factor (sigma-70 family)
MLSTKEVVHPHNSSTKSDSSSLTAALAQIPSVEPRHVSPADESPCTPTDKELTAHARDGDNKAFDQLIKRHRDMCMRRALLMLHDRSDAEDAVRAGCLKAFQYLERFQGKGTFARWLGLVVENQCLRRIREERNAYGHADASMTSLDYIFRIASGVADGGYLAAPRAHEAGVSSERSQIEDCGRTPRAIPGH